eukprot:363184-Chlamydomonas_euryale.AAC.1
MRPSSARSSSGKLNDQPRCRRSINRSRGMMVERLPQVNGRDGAMREEHEAMPLHGTRYPSIGKSDVQFHMAAGTYMSPCRQAIDRHDAVTHKPHQMNLLSW